MKLTDVFKKVAVKRLSRVEIGKKVSHQHEINGVKELVNIFGIPNGKQRFQATALYLSDVKLAGFPASSETLPPQEDFVTWYDAREKHESRTEYRLYYSSSLFLENAYENDLLIVGFDGRQVWLIAVEQSSTIESQLLWIFGFQDRQGDISGNFQIADVHDKGIMLHEIENLILEQLGLEIEADAGIDYEKMLSAFNGHFPTTKEFSTYARADSGIATSLGAPDDTLLYWWNHEERLFRALEKHIVEEHLAAGKFADVDEFIEYAKSVMNRRYSRAGHAFENHLEQVFVDHNLAYARGKTTEGKSRPDFIFPSAERYYAARENPELVPSLTVLGAKTTCKDRWRQITKEAALVDIKHLVTLEPSISFDQTEEMKTHRVQLVVPRPIAASYR
ncbi:MAG: hypothetical protein JXK05_14110 [Campylobacterales bacterium]|nr:hypothetical protein [Campylobacterales bacterium]